MRKSICTVFFLFLFFTFFPWDAFSGPLGDLNDSGTVDLEDAILALQVAAGKTPAGLDPQWTDVNSGRDEQGQVGMEEALYAIWEVAGLNTEPASYSHTVPDTGQTECYDASGSIIPCTGTGQDGEYSIYPMTFTKLDANGNSLPDTSSSWAMVKDNVTGLVWEVKTMHDGEEDYDNIHDADNKYGWFDPNPDTNGGDEGINSENDTLDFITTLNNNHFGGYSDWRLPTVTELRSIVDYSVSFTDSPTIDIDYFPDTVARIYWTGTTSARDASIAWCIYFYHGTDINHYDKTGTHYVRAVRGGEARDFSNWTNNADSTVTDPQTGLMWEVKTRDGGERDKYKRYTWEDALAYCRNLSLAGHSDWRLPTVKEIATIIDLTTENPPINLGYFPNAMGGFYWSSTTNAGRTEKAWYMECTFDGGINLDNDKSTEKYVRAVRNTD